MLYCFGILSAQGKLGCISDQNNRREPKMIRTADQWEAEYKNRKALWIHNGNPRQPHPILSSGDHSNGFFNSRLVTSDSMLLHDATSDLLELFEEHRGDFWQVDGCVGPQTGATRLAQVGSVWVSEYTRRPCFFASPAKHGEGESRSMLFSKEESALLSGKTVLPWEDVVTTGASVGLMVDAVVKNGGVVLSYILALVNRSNLQAVDGRRIVALFKRPRSIEAPSNCSLCKLGSEAIYPKDNWDRFNESC
ncbi:MAG: hypothetical protein A2563_03240 [Candidatus Magasanikbacteria bacterium RIFOXYD1_FULL_40_23]|uniref:Phosphoribosyltransferase domain-containing protein n=1 Tax=Candidatus Magasanikbacteria bacterium RIFOXYD1_FULL_40_23 TaxID=1798705 RepID=A0A1F6P9N3_9BACT|nr:MAG: hypothetical protein A2563_03240 [Candidatus Magasanikbacteria bacterium RIFOXYD1_FULL_40_23]